MKVQKSKIPKDGIFGPHGRLKKFKGHNSSGIYWRMIKILKGGMSKKEDQIKRGRDQLWYYVFLVHLFSRHKYFWSIYLIIFQGLTPREYLCKCLHIKSIFSLSVLKDSVNNKQNSWENKWNASPASGIFIRTLIWAYH